MKQAFTNWNGIRLLASVFLMSLVVVGCRPDGPISASNFNAARWESRMKSPSLSEEEFTRLYAQWVAAQLTNSQVQVAGPRHLKVKMADGGDFEVFLDNAWIEARQDPQHRPDICRRYLAALLSGPAAGHAADAAPDTNALVAVVRDDFFLQQVGQYKGTSNAIVSEPLVADLHVVYAIDSQNGIAYLTQGRLEKIGLPLSALRQLALANLRRLLPPLQRVGAEPLFQLKADGNYESSLLLSDKLWTDQASAVQGELVAAVPARDVLVFTGSSSPAGLDRLRQIVNQTYSGGAHIISKTLLVRRNGRWEKFGD